MAITKKRILAAVIAAVFMQATSVHAMNNAQGAEQEEDQKYDAEDLCSVVKRDKIAEAMFNRSQLSEEAATVLDAAFKEAIYDLNVVEARAKLEAGANVNVVEPLYNITPLLFATREALCDEKVIKIVELLLEYDADLHVTDCQGYTPLLYIVRKGFIYDDQLLEMLIRAGVDVNQCLHYDEWKTWPGERLETPRFQSGASALMIACEYSDESMAKMLLNAGACVHAKTKDKRTVFDFVTPDSGIEQMLKAKRDEIRDAQAVSDMLMQDYEALQQFLIEGGVVKCVSDYVRIPCYCETHKANVVEEDAALVQDSVAAVEENIGEGPVRRSFSEGGFYHGNN